MRLRWLLQAVIPRHRFQAQQHPLAMGLAPLDFTALQVRPRQTISSVRQDDTAQEYLPIICALVRARQDATALRVHRQRATLNVPLARMGTVEVQPMHVLLNVRLDITAQHKLLAQQKFNVAAIKVIVLLEVVSL